MSETQNIQWFPGHMTKTKRQIQANLKLVDAVAEIIDARIPVSSRNPDLNRLIQNKPRVILLNKCDMANQTATKMWIDFYKKQGITSIAVDCKSGRGLNKFPQAVNQVLSEKIARLKSKGMKNPMMRIMIVGIPNVGKSSFINRISKQNRAKVEDRPGVTLNKQWITTDLGFDLLDMPGVLWPKFEDRITGENLALTGAIKDTILDVEELGAILCSRLSALYPDLFAARYKLDADSLADKKGYEILEAVGRRRGFLVSGGEIDTERASIMLLDEFRGCKVGRITLERPEVCDA